MPREREDPGDNCGTGPMGSAALSGLKRARSAEPIGEYMWGLLVCMLGLCPSQAMDSRPCAGRRQGGVGVEEEAWTGRLRAGRGWPGPLQRFQD